jgi:uncharacterized protein YggE
MALHALSTLTVLATLAGGPGGEQPDRVIRVSGEGVATAAPDTATIHTGVVSRADSATEAIAANNKAMTEVLATLKKHGVPEDEVQTSHFNVRPVHERDDDGRVLPAIAGYEVSNQVRVRVGKLDELGKVLDAVVKAGSNRVSGIEFGVSDPTAALDKARRQAVADAKHRAGVLAQEAGVKVGRVVSIQEQSLQRPQPEFRARGLAADAASVPVATGREEFRVTVQMVYAIADGP